MSFLKFLLEEYDNDFKELEHAYRKGYDYHSANHKSDPELALNIEHLDKHISNKYKNVKDEDIDSHIKKLQDAREYIVQKSQEPDGKPNGFHGRIVMKIDGLSRGLEYRKENTKPEIKAADYRIQHQAPDRISGAPLHDVTKNDTYPEDIYVHGVRHYGSGQHTEHESMGIINHVRGKPNRMVTVYRAISNNLTAKDRAASIAKKMKYMTDYNRLPKDAHPADTWDTHYNKLSAEREVELKNAEGEKPIRINKGDWVTGSRRYAVEHGQSNLGNQYKIISKTVPAKHLFTDGNSLDEWGYDPDEHPSH